ncbi:hypothetical protein HNR42_000595 [Deinobacterium chartae]|uniref:Uncharacterized protein n=1 Tax=Deinobacterium chartae TaxID=521158 RepID=A0A841HUN9_9DEIO|nr:hypothetical protein [Deinobacterium chartae]MBB6097181.1 hypothetical protein [Deinobacterium chartae]
MTPRDVATLTLDELMTHDLPEGHLAAEIFGALEMAAQARAAAARNPNAQTAYSGAMTALIMISAVALRQTREDHPQLKPLRFKTLKQIAQDQLNAAPPRLALEVLEAALIARAHLGGAPKNFDPDVPGYLRQEHDPKPWLRLIALAYASGVAHREGPWHIMLP